MAQPVDDHARPAPEPSLTPVDPTVFPPTALDLAALPSVGAEREPLHVEGTVVDGRCLLRVHGELRQETVARFQAVGVDDLPGDDPRTVVVDLAPTTFMDSTGLGALVGLRNELMGRGGRLLLTRPAERVYRLFEITHLDSVFDFVSTDGHGEHPDAPAAPAAPTGG